MTQYILVADGEDQEVMELPMETDGTLLLTTLVAQFTGACGLKYRSPAGTMRGVRIADDKLYPPEEGWGNTLFLCVYPNKRKNDAADHSNGSAAKALCFQSSQPPPALSGGAASMAAMNSNCTDLIVLGLPWSTTEENMREYFEKFGELALVQLKRDPATQKSKGFGFIRFKNFESQVYVLSQRHMMEGRWFDVKIPNIRPQKRSIYTPTNTAMYTTQQTA